MTVAIWVSLCALVIGFSQSGCGGGGGGSSSATNGGTGQTGGNGGTGGGTVSTSVKTATLGSLRQQFIKLQASGSMSQLATYAQTLPGVGFATTENDGNVSVVFKDGTWVTYFNNRPGAPAPIDETPFPPPGSIAVKPHTQAPTANGFRVIGYFGPPGEIDTMNRMFEWKNYNGAVETDASLQNILNIGSSAVVFIDTHGGDVHVLNTKTGKYVQEFGLMLNNLSPYWWDVNTNQMDASPSAQLDPNVQAAVTNGTLGIGCDPGSHQYHLCATASYFAGKWSFAQNSLLFNSVCYSATSDSNSYQLMCQLAGLGYFVGYDETVEGGDAQSDALQLFEGLLGTHIYKPSVRSRAWNCGTYASAMMSSGMATHENGHVHMVGSQMGSLSILSPGISYVYPIDAQNQLVLNGDFGSTQGTVTLDGNELPIVSWSSNKIVCTSSNKHGDSKYSGLVYVTVNNHDSNWIAFQKIEANGSYEEQESDSDLAGALDMKFNWDLFYHYSPQNYRATPFAGLTQPPFYNENGLGGPAASDPTGNYQGSGSESFQGIATDMWNGSGSLVNKLYNSGSTSTYTSSLLQPSNTALKFLLTVVVPDPLWTPPHQTVQVAEGEPQQFNQKIYDDQSLDAMNTTLDSNFNIQPINKQVTFTNQDTALDQGSIKVTFTQTPAIQSALQEDQNPNN